MVFRLLFYVLHNGMLVGLADGKSPISFLPCEFLIGLI